MIDRDHFIIRLIQSFNNWVDEVPEWIDTVIVVICMLIAGICFVLANGVL